MESRTSNLIRDLRPSTLFPSHLKLSINLCLVDVSDLHGLGVELLELVEAEAVRLFNSGRQRSKEVFRRHEDLEPEQGRFRTEQLPAKQMGGYSGGCTRTGGPAWKKAIPKGALNIGGALVEQEVERGHSVQAGRVRILVAPHVFILACFRHRQSILAGCQAFFLSIK